MNEHEPAAGNSNLADLFNAAPPPAAPATDDLPARVDPQSVSPYTEPQAPAPYVPSAAPQQWSPPPSSSSVTPQSLSPAARPVSIEPIRVEEGAAVSENHEHRLQIRAQRNPNKPKLERLLTDLVANDGSDLHIEAGDRPWIRIAGHLRPVADEPVMTTQDINLLFEEALKADAWQNFLREKDEDTAYQMSVEAGSDLTARFRVNLYQSMGLPGAVIRVIPSEIVTLDQLGLMPQIRNFARLPRGMVLFVGPTGSGKSTSMAALVHEINSTRQERIWTLEDPIEFTHKSIRSKISHREIGEDTKHFLEGLKRVRRQDPDVILIGEMRDYATISAAVEAAESGHLVISTLHSNNTSQTITRIVNAFPEAAQDQIRTTLSVTLEGIVAQTLVTAPNSPRGRVVANEILMATPAVRANIRRNDIPSIANSLLDKSSGSIHLDAHLADLVRAGTVRKSDALLKATSPESLERLLGSAA